jgi:predicted solute-binding protein
MTRPVVGTVKYLNAHPLTSYIDRERVTLVSDVPAGIALKLHQGLVNIALVPVVEILGRPEYLAVPRVMIGADGPVQSVFLVSETPPEQWERIVLDGESRTSAMLARLLVAGPLKNRCSAEIQWVQGEQACGIEQAKGRSAALVIGDSARSLPSRLGFRLDLAGLWKEWTGLPFVFALWAGREDVDASLVAHLQSAALRGVLGIGDTYQGEDREYLLKGIAYDLDIRALQGLNLFASLLEKNGLLPSASFRFYHARDGADRSHQEPLLQR